MLWSTPAIKGDLGAYPINMKHIVEGMISAPHEEVAYFGKLAFFAGPDANGAVLIDELIAYERLIFCSGTRTVAPETQRIPCSIEKRSLSEV